jgi:hypothetical protein
MRFGGICHKVDEIVAFAELELFMLAVACPFKVIRPVVHADFRVWNSAGRFLRTFEVVNALVGKDESAPEAPVLAVKQIPQVQAPSGRIIEKRIKAEHVAICPPGTC